MQASAVKHGCRFHRAWFARDESAFYALAKWDTREGASAFFNEWEIEVPFGLRLTLRVRKCWVSSRFRPPRAWMNNVR
jgi:hypothetical protein